MSKLSRSAMGSLLAVSAALIAAGATPALAQADETVVVSSNSHAGTTTKTLAVSTRDLDLSKAGDHARLERRIADAVDRVCSSDAIWDRHSNLDYTRCRTNAFAMAMARLPAAGAAVN